MTTTDPIALRLSTRHRAALASIATTLKGIEHRAPMYGRHPEALEAQVGVVRFRAVARSKPDSWRAPLKAGRSPRPRRKTGQSASRCSAVGARRFLLTRTSIGRLSPPSTIVDGVGPAATREVDRSTPWIGAAP